jgi:hypothetical protein
VFPWAWPTLSLFARAEDGRLLQFVKGPNPEEWQVFNTPSQTKDPQTGREPRIAGDPVVYAPAGQDLSLFTRGVPG